MYSCHISCFLLSVLDSCHVAWYQHVKMAPLDPTKKVLEDFIEIYRTHPYLWKIKNKEYHDQDKRKSAYKLLIEKLREIKPDTNKAVVVRKINKLISNVTKEKKET